MSPRSSIGCKAAAAAFFCWIEAGPRKVGLALHSSPALYAASGHRRRPHDVPSALLPPPRLVRPLVEHTTTANRNSVLPGLCRRRARPDGTREACPVPAEPAACAVSCDPGAVVALYRQAPLPIETLEVSARTAGETLVGVRRRDDRNRVYRRPAARQVLQRTKPLKISRVSCSQVRFRGCRRPFARTLPPAAAASNGGTRQKLLTMLSSAQ